MTDRLYEEVQIELAKLRLETQNHQLESLKRLERYAMWTMITMAAHAGVTVLVDVPKLAPAAGLAALLALRFWA